MTDYGHDLLFGSFITPANAAPERVVGLAQLSEQACGAELARFGRLANGKLIPRTKEAAANPWEKIG